MARFPPDSKIEVSNNFFSNGRYVVDDNRFDVWAQGSMSRIFPNQKPPAKAKKRITLQAAGNEVASFQVGISGTSHKMKSFEVVATDMVSSSGKIIPKDKIDVLYAGYVPVPWNSPGSSPDDLEKTAPCFFPDPLFPPTWRGYQVRGTFPGAAGAWIRVHIGASLPAGKYHGKIKVIISEKTKTIGFTIEVLPFHLPENSHFLMSNWFIAGSVLHLHNLTLFTGEFWKVVEIYAKNLSSHRQNVILTPLFAISYRQPKNNDEIGGQLINILEKSPGKYLFDYENFDKWVNIFFKNGFKIIEGSHLAGGSVNPATIILKKYGKIFPEKYTFSSTLSKGYRNFIKQFLSSLRQHLIEKGWIDKFCMHISDEPSGEQLKPYTSLTKLVKTIAPEFKLMDALADLPFVKKLYYPVPLINKFEQVLAESEEALKKNIWFYYCCVPGGKWPNRFMDYNLIRVRIFTWLAFKYKAKGFLHWGLNYWNWHPPFHREGPYNPYDNTTGGSLQAGDSHVLYPPPMPGRSHEPVDSIRWEIIRKAMEDYEYLYLLRDLLKKEQIPLKLKEQGEGLMKELEEKVVPNFTEYTRDAEYLEDFRSRVAKLIIQIKKSGEI